MLPTVNCLVELQQARPRLAQLWAGQHLPGACWPPAALAETPLRALRRACS